LEAGWEQEASGKGGAGLHQARDRRGLEVSLASFAGLSPFNSFIVITLKMPLYIERAKQQLCWREGVREWAGREVGGGDRTGKGIKQEEG
jgi:hypothetical protein